MSLVFTDLKFAAVMRNIERGVYDRAQAAMRLGADQMKLYAQLTAPWTDRTGNARRTLTGVSGMNGQKCEAVIAGQMPYSPNLELSYGGRYSVLYPTALFFAGAVFEDVGERVKKGGGMVSDDAQTA